MLPESVARNRFLLFGALLLTVGAGVFHALREEPESGPDDDLLAQVPHLGRPDDDFVGSQVCAECHEDEHESWDHSFHSSMTQLATPDVVRAPFDRTLRSGKRSYKVWREGSAYYVDMVDPAWDAEQYRRRPGVLLDEHPDPPRVTRRVVMVTGSHHMQMYWVGSGKGADRRLYVLPFAYVFQEQRWVPREDVFLFPPDRQRMLPVWNDNCLRCHTTGGQPRFDRGTGAPRDARGITRHPASLQNRAKGKVPAQNFPMAEPLLDSFYWPDGMIRVSGREYNGLIESPCYLRGPMTCLSCHTMHSGDPNDQLVDRMRGDAACLQCHEEIGNDLAAHTHHAPTSSGSRCYNCHMPHTTHGLLSAIRSHQISSPRGTDSVPPTGRPNACNLCHLDQTLAWTQKHLEDWYDIKPVTEPAAFKDVAASLVWLIQGDAGQRALSRGTWVGRAPGRPRAATGSSPTWRPSCSRTRMPRTG